MSPRTRKPSAAESPFPVHTRDQGPDVGPSATQARCWHATTHPSSPPPPHTQRGLFSPRSWRGAGEGAPEFPPHVRPGLRIWAHTRGGRAPPGKAASALIRLTRLPSATQSRHPVRPRRSPESRRPRAHACHTRPVARTVRVRTPVTPARRTEGLSWPGVLSPLLCFSSPFACEVSRKSFRGSLLLSHPPRTSVQAGFGPRPCSGTAAVAVAVAGSMIPSVI